MSFVPVLGTAFCQYFFVSFASAVVKEGFENVGGSLYASKWYLLKPEDRKDFFMLLMMGQKVKTLTVGTFGFSNLERFTQVR